MKLARLYPRRLVHRLSLHVSGLSIGVRAVVNDDNGAILLVRHTYVPGWHFPGGGVHPGETALHALQRELAEEAAIAPTAPARLAGIYLNRRLHGRDHVLLYRCDSWKRLGKFRPNFEIAEAAFFPLDDLPRSLSRGTARRIGEMFRSDPVEDEW